VTSSQFVGFVLTIAASNETFTNPIPLSAGALAPEVSSSSATSPRITPNAASTTFALTIPRKAQTSATTAYFHRGDWPVLVWLGLIGTALCLAGLVLPKAGGRLQQRLAPQFPLALLPKAVAGAIARNGSGSGTFPPAQITSVPGTWAGIYSIPIIMTSGAILHTSQATLTGM
jgi:hypothetical protein